MWFIKQYIGPLSPGPPTSDAGCWRLDDVYTDGPAPQYLSRWRNGLEKVFLVRWYGLFLVQVRNGKRTGKRRHRGNLVVAWRDLVECWAHAGLIHCVSWCGRRKALGQRGSSLPAGLRGRRTTGDVGAGDGGGGAGVGASARRNVPGSQAHQDRGPHRAQQHG